ncbi:hypothetical protein CPB84DRAFT_875157 [Gymnopilus junonius]|uniref:Uncharacterized protein n=1 Tax=Gymnopilus junonius TaxID=109634 RepID=A0A9P5NSC1_GYMJU|nr:hypothetical protein CPB84DRAFT_875157 [Gymnopilus junonius]
MASLDLIQKHALVRALGSEESAVELVERYTIGGVDLILDPYCAVVFLSLFTLPARCEAYVDRVSKQSWIYNHLLIVFEAYPEQLSKRANTNRVGGSASGSSSSSSLYTYTPPIVKAIKISEEISILPRPVGRKGLRRKCNMLLQTMSVRLRCLRVGLEIERRRGMGRVG